MEQKRYPGIFTGAVIGLLLTAPLIAIFYAGEMLLGLPFLPFDLFVWVGQVLPGEIITVGIDSIVGIVTGLNLGETSSAAKLIEQALGIAMVMGIGVVSGAIFFAVMRATQNRHRYLAGLIYGVLVGVPMLWIITGLPTWNLNDQPLMSMIWVIGLFLIWGVAHNVIFHELSSVETESIAGQRISIEPIDRRSFLVRVGAGAATITVIGAGLGAMLRRETGVQTVALPEGATGTASASTTRWSDNNPLPNADVEPMPAPGTRPELTPVEDHYRIDITIRPPELDASEWRLNVSGLFDNPAMMTLDELMNSHEPIDAFITMSCISNQVGGDLIGTQRWTGIRLNELLADWSPQSNATALKISSADGFDEFLDLETAMSDDRIMLCYAWDGEQLPVRNGFPLRVHIPNHFGMKQPKWITDIEAVEDAGEGYWVRRGWSAEAIALSTSVIDTVADQSAVDEDGQTLVPIGGISWAGDRGISSVEVQVDGGEWAEAELREPLSDRTWIIWRYDWPFVEGMHTFAVRAFEGDGTMQIVTNATPHPDGASGIH
ncbi:MAG: molybdopterin-dependent oxidoreductase, partial [Burkholderiales bacterium]|nr:molybdopterin-dependent oxidoreductase [Anaerolineae bacterium]